MALLAAYAVNNPEERTLDNWLEVEVFDGNTGVEIAPRPDEVDGFRRYLDNFIASLPVERAAIEAHS